MTLPLIRKLENYVHLTDNEKSSLMQAEVQVRDVEARSDIVCEHQEVEGATLVLEGFACRYRLLPDGRRQILAYMLPGDMCDLHSVPVPRTGWGMEALTVSKVAFVPHEALRSLAHDLNLALAFWRDTAVDAILKSVAASPVLGYRGPFILDGKMPETPLADVTLQQKDMLLALDLGRKMGSPVPLAAAANEIMNACRGLGIDHNDFVVAHQVYRRLGGQST